MTLVCVQFITDEPEDYRNFDSDSWNQVPDLPVNAICIQGVVFSGYDHYTVIPLQSGGCKAICWKDDTHDYTPGYFQARVFNFPPYGPEEALRGAINTRQTSEVYAGIDLMKYYTAIGNTPTRIVKPYSDFISPAGSKILHGAWVTDPMFEALYQTRRHMGWRDWGENGDGPGDPVPMQRPLGRFKEPLGTMTWFLRVTTLASGVHTVPNELELNQTVGGEELDSENIGANLDKLSHMWTTLAGNPGVAWPTDVNGTIDASNVGGEVDFGFLSLGSSDGHIARVNTGLTSDVDSKTQAEAFFEGSGIQTFTVSGSWTVGSDADDRLEMLLAASRPADHGNQPLEIRHGADSFITGAWVSAVVGADHPYDGYGSPQPYFRKPKVVGF